MNSSSGIADPLDLLTRGVDLQRLLIFVQALEEEMVVATADAVRAIPDATCPSAKQARGSTRRHFMHQAIDRAAVRAGIKLDTGWTKPATWSYPIIRLGAFTLVLGLVFSRQRGAKRHLRTRSSYVEGLCARNASLNPQGHLFGSEMTSLPVVIPDGAFGGLIVSEHGGGAPEIPSFLGFWIPSNDLKQHFHSYSFGQVMGYIRDKLAGQKKPVRKLPQRKLPQLRMKSPRTKN